LPKGHDSLDDKAKLTVADAILSRVVRLGGEIASRAVETLGRIGWEVHDGGLVASNPDLREMLFPTSSPWDDYVVIRDICVEARSSLTIIDAYCDGTIFQMLAARPLAALSVQIL